MKMMKISELLQQLHERYPFENSADWDNIGLQLGNPNTIIDMDNVFVSLDVTSEVIDKLPDNATLITHHPLIFKGVKSIITSEYVGKMIQKLIEKNITYIVLHTNYDNAYLNKFFVEDILGEKVSGESDSLLFYNENIILEKHYFEILKEQIEVDKITVVNSNNIIKKVAVCTGSGGSMIKEAKENGADLLITGDVTYHQAIEAKEIGISVIDVTHFHSERYFGSDLAIDFGFKMIKQTNPMVVI